MNTKRIEEIQKQTAYPESHSVTNALCQVWHECEIESNAIKEENERLKIIIKNVCNAVAVESQSLPLI